MATRQQLTDAIDVSILSLLKYKGDLRATELEQTASAIASLVYARSDLIRTDCEVMKLDQMKGRVA